jgi:hypothetical protein
LFYNVKFRLLVALGTLLVFSSQERPSTTADCEGEKNRKLDQLRADRLNADAAFKRQNASCNAEPASGAKRSAGLAVRHDRGHPVYVDVQPARIGVPSNVDLVNTTKQSKSSLRGPGRMDSSTATS